MSGRKRFRCAEGDCTGAAQHGAGMDDYSSALCFELIDSQLFMIV